MARILIVDNDEDLNSIIEFNLQQRGYEVVLARNGEEALAKLQAPWPDLVLLDIVLPCMDGFAVVEHLAEQPETAAAHVVFLTARSSLEDFERARHVRNFAGYFTKPYATLDVLRHIDKVLGRPD